eukprot:SM013632S00011  [mRNA]  locus=s13632:129:330:- [translate_table: standard]
MAGAGEAPAPGCQSGVEGHVAGPAGGQGRLPVGY